MNENDVRHFFDEEWNSLRSLIRELEEEAWNVEPLEISADAQWQNDHQPVANSDAANDTQQSSTDRHVDPVSDDRLSSLMQQIERRLNANRED